ncbi:27671_t:CDS:1, partial [Racocetra persica]
MSENSANSSNSAGVTASCPVNHSSRPSIFAPKTSVDPKNSVTLQCPSESPKVSPEFSNIGRNEGCS